MVETICRAYCTAICAWNFEKMFSRLIVFFCFIVVVGLSGLSFLLCIFLFHCFHRATTVMETLSLKIAHH